jgi:hypothetical protein
MPPHVATEITGYPVFQPTDGYVPPCPSSEQAIPSRPSSHFPADVRFESPQDGTEAHRTRRKSRACPAPPRKGRAIPAGSSTGRFAQSQAAAPAAACVPIRPSASSRFLDHWCLRQSFANPTSEYLNSRTSLRIGVVHTRDPEDPPNSNAGGRYHGVSTPSNCLVPLLQIEPYKPNRS